MARSSSAAFALLLPRWSARVRAREAAFVALALQAVAAAL
jgi:hypothetical protein